MRKTKNENPLAHCNLTTILSRKTSYNTNIEFDAQSPLRLAREFLV